MSGRNAPNIDNIHYIPPRPQEIGDLMHGWIEAATIALQSDAPAVVVAAAIAWSFVFLHPFSDGNGRMHRFLIHHVLARRGFVPDGMIFPVFAAMLDTSRTRWGVDVGVLAGRFRRSLSRGGAAAFRPRRK